MVSLLREGHFYQAFNCGAPFLHIFFHLVLLMTEEARLLLFPPVLPDFFSAQVISLASCRYCFPQQHFAVVADLLLVPTALAMSSHCSLSFNRWQAICCLCAIARHVCLRKYHICLHQKVFCSLSAMYNTCPASSLWMKFPDCVWRLFLSVPVFAAYDIYSSGLETRLRSVAMAFFILLLTVLEHFCFQSTTSRFC